MYCQSLFFQCNFHFFFQTTAQFHNHSHTHAQVIYQTSTCAPIPQTPMSIHAQGCSPMTSSPTGPTQNMQLSQTYSAKTKFNCHPNFNPQNSPNSIQFRPIVETVQVGIDPKISQNDAIEFFAGWNNCDISGTNTIESPSRFPVCTKSWAPNFSTIINQAAQSIQGAAIRQNQTVKESHSKFENNNSNNFIGLMRPRGGALRHPAAEELLQYATTGCPVDCGRDWTKEEIWKAIKKGACPSATNPLAVKCCREETL